MKRIGLLLLLLVLLLSACSEQTHTFVLSADGGYLDEETDILYRALDSAYEASGAGNEVGRFANEAYDYEAVFYEIPDMDPNVFLTDDYGDVYFAGAELPDASRWEIDTVLVCRVVGELSEVKGRFAVDSHAALVEAVRAAWFEGDDLGPDVLLLERVTAHYPVKLGRVAYPNLYYAIELRVTESGNVYLTDKYGKRAVLLDAALSEQLREVI